MQPTKNLLKAFLVLCVIAMSSMCVYITLDYSKPQMSKNFLDVSLPTKVPKLSAPDEMEGYDDRLNRTVPTWAKVNGRHPKVLKGGRYKPEKTSHKITILIPYRDRRVHLKLFLDYMHPFLMRQNLDYVIYVVEMEAEGLFRKTVLMNAGFLEIVKRENASCVFFHDVDFIPTNNDNLYHCDKTVRHFANAVQQYRYKLFYHSYIGGVIAFPVHLYRKVNGFSNVYSGWGAEDNDMHVRITKSRVPFSRQDPRRGRYDCFLHSKQPPITNADHFHRTAAQRMYKEGLNTVNYTIITFQERRLFTWILINTTLTPAGYDNVFAEHKKYNKTKKATSVTRPISKHNTTQVKRPVTKQNTTDVKRPIQNTTA